MIACSKRGEDPSDGEDAVRNLQLYMSLQVEHISDCGASLRKD